MLWVAPAEAEVEVEVLVRVELVADEDEAVVSAVVLLAALTPPARTVTPTIIVDSSILRASLVVLV